MLVQASHADNAHVANSSG